MEHDAPRRVAGCMGKKTLLQLDERCFRLADSEPAPRQSWRNTHCIWRDGSHPTAPIDAQSLTLDLPRTGPVVVVRAAMPIFSVQ